jgi:hypothetical protein
LIEYHRNLSTGFIIEPLICHGKKRFKRCVNREYEKKAVLENQTRTAFFNTLCYLTLTSHLQKIKNNKHSDHDQPYNAAACHDREKQYHV